MTRAVLIPLAAMAVFVGAGCSPASLGLAAAGMVIDAMVEPSAAPPTDPETNIMQALSGLDDQVSETCLRKRASLLGSSAPPDAAEGTDRASGQQEGTDAPKDPEGPETCGVEPVCLPGNSEPIPMMVCVNPEADPRPVLSASVETEEAAAWQWSGRAVE